MEERLRLLSKTQPRSAMPTKIRRIRRVCVNIEANGCRPCRCLKSMNSLYYPDESVYYNPWNLDKGNQMQQHMNSSVYAHAMHNLCSPGMAAGSSSGLNYGGTRLPAGVTVCNNSSQEEAIAELKYMLDTLEQQQQMTDMGAYYSSATQATNSLISPPSFHPCVHPVFHPHFQPHFRSNLQPCCQPSSCSTHASQNSEGSAHTVLDYTQDLGESLTEEAKAEGKEAAEDTTPQGERDNQIKTLTDLMRQTMRKLDNYMTLQSAQQQQQQQQAQGSQLNMNSYLDLPRLTQYMKSSLPMTLVNSLQQPAKTRGKRLVKVMPVQPLVIMPAQTATAPAATPAPAAPVEPPAKYRVRVRRKRPSSGKSTSKSQVAESCPASSCQVEASGQNMRDSSTTMWCPRDCCKHCCGVVTESKTRLPKSPEPAPTPAPVAPLSIPIQLYAMGTRPSLIEASSCPARMERVPPALSKKPPTRLQGNKHNSDYEIGYDVDDELDRNRASKLSYAYIEEEEEEQEQDRGEEEKHELQQPKQQRQRLPQKLEPEPDPETETEPEQSSSDHWYNNARYSLAQLEKQESYFTNMELEQEREREVEASGSTCNKLQQTDSCSTMDNSTDSSLTPTRFIATTDKSVSTNDMQQVLQAAKGPPVKIVRICKTSSMKSRRGKTPTKNKSKARVKFDKSQAKLHSVESNVNPFLVAPHEQLPKYRMLKSMSETRSDAGQSGKRKRRYTAEQEARYQRLMEEVESIESEMERNVSNEFKCNPMASSSRLRCHGGSVSSVYPTGWTQ
ncbi:uncharacterized protein [Drosophila virilis]|uniref:Uncharacterized protein, isoform A n=1 Tax=Drosophila virilis TaxID=7244 RepID=B4LTC7_DROVI|nr:uncharacterized protein LOC6627685 [Drosophila virilis]EDW63897.2 uncharacterized protein Dvir_GJ17157, isoform A [Drosophila virilis]KRF81347.1 uncharacterized protein Dvir_GJ17157, isoform B [Drosophila virilis]